MEQARMVKDAKKIERIRAAVLMGADLFDSALAAIRPGVMETQVAAEMEYAARRAGAEAHVFPHHRCCRTAVGLASRAGFPDGGTGQGIRGLRLRCYTLPIIVPI